MSKSPVDAPYRSRLWIWLKVAIVLIVIDLSVFDTGLFWRLTPGFDEATVTENENWRFVHSTAREIETHRSSAAPVVVIGSSILRWGLDAPAVNAQLKAKGLPVEVLPFISLGSSATDAALVAWQARNVNPWLVIYAAATRDFQKPGIVDSAVKRTFYDSSVELPLWPRQGVDAETSAFVKRYWKLYRYRFFARRLLQTAVQSLSRSLLSPRTANAQAPLRASAPPEAFQYFDPLFVDADSYAAWKKWRASRHFEDYVEWIRIRGGQPALALYKVQNLDTCGPENNPHAAAFEWMLGRLNALGMRFAVIYFPENPVFLDPAANAYFDQRLSAAYAELFGKAARDHGDRFADWRSLLEPEDFYDMIHVNLAGRRKLTDLFVRLIEDEWRSRQLESLGS